MAEHNELGQRGEALAVDYLKENGFEILATNWYWQNNEVDIIAKQKDLIIFVEVKTRKTNYFGEPEVFVNKVKQKAYIKLADVYIMQNSYNYEVRFDIISVLISSSQTKVKHIPAAFSAVG